MFFFSRDGLQTGYLGSEPYTFHRLDMYTSGVMVFGKQKEVLKPLMTANKARKVRISFQGVAKVNFSTCM